MNFKPSREFAIEQLDKFIEKNLIEYSKLRNFDFGPDRRSNVSCISPYVNHGVVNESEIINKSLKKFSFIKNEKFIQEVLWRVYWKGWMELRPKVWTDFLNDLNEIKIKYQNNENYLNAINGKTNIDCFNYWVDELKKYNYLHNHTRMWFASIWIFTLELPWQLGAEFFMKHLFDGDSASNTLGWRWVAGIQTKGKHYSAQEWNIKKFTNNKFDKIKLNENSLPKTDGREYSIINKEFIDNAISEEKKLLVFDNNLSFENTEFANKNFKKIFLVLNGKETRKIKLSEKVLNFKKFLIHDQEIRLKQKSISCEIINIEELKNINEDIYALYPSVGENLDYINSINIKNIKFLYRKIDKYSWKFCNKGFFNFKNYIPKIVQEFI
jgi:deoxyribodipyrimidine photo-lyase